MREFFIFWKLFLCLEIQGKSNPVCELSLVTYWAPQKMVCGFNLATPLLHSYSPKFYVGSHCAGCKKEIQVATGGTHFEE